MRKIFIAYLSVYMLLTSCQNSSQRSVEPTKNAQYKEQVEDKFLYLKFVDLSDANEYKNYIDLVKKELLHNGYIAEKAANNDWQGIRKIENGENIKKVNLNQYHPYIHRFKSFSEYHLSNGTIEKIVITINKPVNDSILNFNFRSYKNIEDGNWQSIFNPGNFRFINRNISDTDEFANWMVKKITTLTFK